MPGDPGVRKHGRCRVCGTPRPELAVANKDPFCSTSCCRQHYKVIDTGLATAADDVAAEASVAANQIAKQSRTTRLFSRCPMRPSRRQGCSLTPSLVRSCRVVLTRAVGRRPSVVGRKSRAGSTRLSRSRRRATRWRAEPTWTRSLPVCSEYAPRLRHRGFAGAARSAICLILASTRVVDHRAQEWSTTGDGVERCREWEACLVGSLVFDGLVGALGSAQCVCRWLVD
jgi:hypothetical protein